MLLGLEGFSDITTFNNPQDAVSWLEKNDVTIRYDFKAPKRGRILELIVTNITPEGVVQRVSPGKSVAAGIGGGNDLIVPADL